MQPGWLNGKTGGNFSRESQVPKFRTNPFANFMMESGSCQQPGDDSQSMTEKDIFNSSGSGYLCFSNLT
jgi:hypothetical protein